ncbi:MAG: glycosyltransferase [Minisyncoccota bacterium]
MMTGRSVWVGFDQREAAAYAVALTSIRQHMRDEIEINGLVLQDHQRSGLFTRPMHRDPGGRLIDEISVRGDYDGAISTEHANLRFVVPFLADKEGWVLFCDGDILVRADLNDLFDGLDDRFAAYCVKHDYRPADDVKMDSQRQTVYARKNWTSVWAVQPRHPAMKRLTLTMVNTLPGRDLHALSWLNDDEIGSLDPKWNWLVGHSDPEIDPALAHFTTGTPDMLGYSDVPYAEEWRSTLLDWAADTM